MENLAAQDSSFGLILSAFMKGEASSWAKWQFEGPGRGREAGSREVADEHAAGTAGHCASWPMRGRMGLLVWRVVWVDLVGVGSYGDQGSPA